MKNKTFGAWEPFQIEIIKNGERTHVTVMRRKRPNGHFEFQETTHPLVKMLNPRENSANEHFQKGHTKTTKSNPNTTT